MILVGTIWDQVEDSRRVLKVDTCVRIVSGLAGLLFRVGPAQSFTGYQYSSTWETQELVMSPCSKYIQRPLLQHYVAV